MIFGICFKKECPVRGRLTQEGKGLGEMSAWVGVGSCGIRVMDI